MTMLFALLLAAGTPASTEDTQVIHLKDAKFAPATMAGFPQGISNAPIGVDPSTKGGTGYGKLTAGTKLPEHTHNYAEYTVLISGHGTLTVDGKPQQIAPGDYFILAAKTPHSLTCKKGSDCVLLTRRAGPTDYHFTEKDAQSKKD
jgi:mannose-6-phosphate isomerase-like protein (cupin superfamily)